MTDDWLELDFPPSPEIDSSVPHSARIWNYWLGGKDNYPVDQAAGDKYAETYPDIADAAKAFRAFMKRAVSHLAIDAGVRQFLDVGTGLPTADNTHEIVQRIAPESRVVYVDNDPLVLTHARVLLRSGPQGRTAYVDADMRDPDLILSAAGQTLNLAEPVALLFIGVLGHVAPYGDAQLIVSRLVSRLAPGSYLVLADGTNQRENAATTESEYADTGAVAYHLRTPEEIAAFFEGLQLLEPGVTFLNNWRPDRSTPRKHIASVGAVARK